MTMHFSFEHNGVDQAQPLIYHWTLVHPYDGRVDTYIGQAGNAKRPLKHYRRNLNRLLSGKAYRKNKPDNWRKVHLAMGEVLLAGGSIHLKLLTNVVEHDINAVERKLIRSLKPSLND